MFMEKEKFLFSEEAVILAKARHAGDIPAWITEEQKAQFSSLSDSEKSEILRNDAVSRGEISKRYPPTDLEDTTRPLQPGEYCGACGYVYGTCKCR